jgi:hypothetical protein
VAAQNTPENAARITAPKEDQNSSFAAADATATSDSVVRTGILIVAGRLFLVIRPIAPTMRRVLNHSAGDDQYVLPVLGGRALQHDARPERPAR